MEKNRPKKQNFKIPFPRLHGDSAKEHSYEVSSLRDENRVCKSLNADADGRTLYNNITKYPTSVGGYKKEYDPMKFKILNTHTHSYKHSLISHIHTYDHTHSHTHKNILNTCTCTNIFIHIESKKTHTCTQIQKRLHAKVHSDKHPRPWPSSPAHTYIYTVQVVR